MGDIVPYIYYSQSSVERGMEGPFLVFVDLVAGQLPLSVLLPQFHRTQGNAITTASTEDCYS